MLSKVLKILNSTEKKKIINNCYLDVSGCNF